MVIRLLMRTVRALPAAQRLGFAFARFAVYAFAFGVAAGPGRTAGFLLCRRAFNQRFQTRQRILFIQLKGTMFLRLDHNYAVAGNALIRQFQQPLLVKGRQRRALNIKAQVDSRGHLVDILPAGPLGTDLFDMDFPIGQYHVIGYT